MSRDRRPILIKQLTSDHLVNTWENEVMRDVTQTIKYRTDEACRIFTNDRSQSFRFYRRVKRKFPLCNVYREVDFYGVYHIIVEPPRFN